MVGTIAWPSEDVSAWRECSRPDRLQRRRACRSAACPRGRRKFPSGDWRQAGEKDGARAFKEYFGYFGTFSIDTERQVVTHHVEGSWFPNLEGSDQERHYRFENDLLVLDAHTDWGKVRIVWRKHS